jgi:hypothetical protein
VAQNRCTPRGSRARSVRSWLLETLPRQVTETPLGEGLFAWTPMFDLCIVQMPVSYPYDGPFLRVLPVSADKLEFRYLDTFYKPKQRHRTVDAEQAWLRPIQFLDQLRSFPADVLASVRYRSLGRRCKIRLQEDRQRRRLS